MRVYTLERRQFIPAALPRVWEYFSDPRNLNALTPPQMHFEILNEAGLSPMYAGQLLAYRIRIAPGLRIRWLTEIKHLVDQSYFADEQRFGPYKIWYHEHHFTPRPDGVEMRDIVTYALGRGWMGQLAHALWVRRQLEQIFAFRSQAVAQIFG